VKEIKIRTANIIGKPSPFLMMAPKGSYKEHHKQAYAITNLSKKASWWLLMFFACFLN
jgi:hypothetical protein